MAFQFFFSRSIRDYNQKAITAMDEEDAAFEDANGTPLSAIAEAFEELSKSVKSGNSNALQLKPFCEACSLVSVLFGSLGIAFKFAEYEYCSKVRDLVEASEIYGTLHNILDIDVRNDTVKTPGSLSRNLRRVRQGIDLIRALFENFLCSDYCSLKEAASTAYAQVCAPYHTWAVRTAVSAGMCALPTREQLLLKLNETDESAEKEMRRYIKASRPVIEYIDKLYVSRNISLDW
ncbi:ACD11 homolog protein-like [Actinidia eriantha]|uniref:ACD11 homolog protein-like n=1 Tax=Actinidia eriantha TaxID=165200 RepID=UPI00258FD2F2|nr:ACD11 homolog protein-like [Actinidia eriantha]